jgi:hypothetical protein
MLHVKALPDASGCTIDATTASILGKTASEKVQISENRKKQPLSHRSKNIINPRHIHIFYVCGFLAFNVCIRQKCARKPLKQEEQGSKFHEGGSIFKIIIKFEK